MRNLNEIILLHAIIEKMQYKNVGKFIRAKREAYGESLNNFALECEIDSATLRNFETGKGDVLFQNFIKIARGFGVMPSELLKEFECEE